MRHTDSSGIFTLIYAVVIIVFLYSSFNHSSCQVSVDQPVRSSRYENTHQNNYYKGPLEDIPVYDDKFSYTELPPVIMEIIKESVAENPIKPVFIDSTTRVKVDSIRRISEVEKDTIN